MVATAEKVDMILEASNGRRVETNLHTLNVLNGELDRAARVRPPVMGDDDEFLEDRALANRAQRLIEDHHMAAGQYTVRYLWKRKGGKTNGAQTLGKCMLASGLVKFWGGCDAVIWLAADHLAGKSGRVIEAVLFHELCHIGSDEETLEIKLMPHQFAGFNAELDHYGLYLDDLVLAKEHFDQAAMPL